MAGNEEGGVRTKKMIAALAVFAMVFTAGAAFIGSSSGVDGASAVIEGETNLVKTGGSLTYQIMFYEDKPFETLDLSYSAVLKDADGNTQSGAVSPSTGSLTNGVESTLTIKAPAAAGKYILTVTFTEKIDGGSATTTERTQTITVREPITLTAVLKNNSNVDFTDFAVYFRVDGVLVEESKQLITVKSGETTTVKYEWVTESISNGAHAFQVVAGEENIGDYSGDVIVGGKGEFYVGHSDYGLINILLVVALIVMGIFLFYIYRKPVKNYGKPKSRR
jgi:hypothetical protein